MRGRTRVPTSGSRPTYPRSYLVIAWGVTERNTPLPPRSTSTSSFSRAFMAKMNWASLQRGVWVPPIETIRSPGRKPAAAAGELGSTTRTTGGWSS